MKFDTIIKDDVTAVGKLSCSTLIKPTVVLRELNTIRIVSSQSLTKIRIRLRESWGLESCKVSDTIGVSGLYSGVVSTPEYGQVIKTVSSLVLVIGSGWGFSVGSGCSLVRKAVETIS